MKTIKRALIILLLTGAAAPGLKAQVLKPADGIFLTEQDFKAHTPNYPIDAKDKLELNEFFEGKSIFVKHKGQNTRLLKRDVYGYSLQGENFRFFNNQVYKILDTTGFVLYSRQKLTQQGRGYAPVLKYFYSVGLRQPLLSLTIDNLCNSFADQTAFRYSIQNFFSKDAHLMEYDKQAGMYKIKYLYLQQRQPRANHAAL